MKRAGICPMCGEPRLLVLAPVLVATGEDGAERMTYMCKECAWPSTPVTDEEDYVPEGWYPHD